MNNISAIYVDGVSHIHVTGNLVRFDLITLQPHAKDEKGQPVYEITQRMIMPLEGFIQAFNLQEAIVQNLVSNGVAQRNAPNHVDQKTNAESEQNV